MKIISAIAGLGLLALLTANVSALDRRVEIVNQSSSDMMEFYASNTGTKSWEEDIFGQQMLPAGNSVIVNIDDGSGYCKYDFLAVFANGAEVTSADNNVCELSRFSFTD